MSERPKIRDVVVGNETISADLADGRVISVPLAWSWRVSEATPEQRSQWKLIGDGEGVRSPEIDEDISAEACFTAFRPVVLHPGSSLESGFRTKTSVARAS